MIFYTRTMALMNVLDIVMLIGQAILLIENLLPVTCSCKVKGFFLGAAKKEKTVALSTAEVEYLALSAACLECLWLRQLTTELDSRPVGPTVIYG